MREGWEYKRLGELCDIVMGQSPMGNSINENNGIEFHQGKTNFGDKFLMESGIYTTSPIRIAEKKTILLCVRAPVGIINITERQVCIGRGLSSLKPRLGLELLYLYYCLLSKQNYFESNSTGSTFKAISSKVINNTIIQFPPKPTQLSIVSELDKLNELIQIKKEQLKDYDALAQSIFYEMFGDPVENEKGWEVMLLADVCHSITDGDHMPPPKTDRGIPFLTISNINKETRILDFSDTFFVPQSYYVALKESRKPMENDLLYTVTGSYGIPVVVDGKNSFCFQRHIALLRPNVDKVLTLYLCYWCLCPSIKQVADKVATGIAQKTVSLTSLRKFSIILPPLSLQQSFAHKIEQIERQKAAVQSTITDLETLLAARMQYWFD